MKFLQNEPIRIGPEQYACPYCGKLLKSRAEVVRHIRIHTGETPFSCNYCNYRTKWKSSLKLHIDRRHKFNDFVNNM